MRAAGSGSAEVGAGLRLDFVVQDETRRAIDLSGYEALSFLVTGWGTVFVEVMTNETVTVAEGGTCQGDGCSDHYHVSIAQSPDEWHEHLLEFANFRQHGWGTPKDFRLDQVLALSFTLLGNSGDSNISIDSLQLATNLRSEAETGNEGGVAVAARPGAREGFLSRFWDCCKPHCAWSSNGATVASCDAAGASTEAESASACEGGGGSYTCYDLAPRAISEDLAYGYAATPPTDALCGRCFELRFTGNALYGKNRGPGNTATGERAVESLAGKRLIVQAVNIGHDVAGNQMDLLVPGGGVGIFNACSAQWGVSEADLGDRFGGFLGKCNAQLGFGADASAYADCVHQQCESVFGARGLSQLEAGCEWFADWLGAADNPKMTYEEVPCPPDL